MREINSLEEAEGIYTVNLNDGPYGGVYQYSKGVWWPREARPVGPRRYAIGALIFVVLGTIGNITNGQGVDLIGTPIVWAVVFGVAYAAGMFGPQRRLRRKYNRMIKDARKRAAMDTALTV